MSSIPDPSFGDCLQPPPGIPPHDWRRISLAKRRLAILGPLTPGRDAFRTAVLAIAAELRLAGVSEDVAVAVCSTMPFTEGNTPRRKVLKSVPAFVKWAYNTPDGQPILSGCPGSQRTGSDATRSKLRETFRPYCDATCLRTCPIVRANRAPEHSIIGTAYEPTFFSSVWMSARQGGLGREAKDVWVVLASIAVVEEREEVYAPTVYLMRRLGGEWPVRSLRRVLARIEDAGLTELLNKHTGLRRVPALSHEAIETLERKLGTSEAARWNAIEANYESLRHTIAMPSWDVAEALGQQLETVTLGRKNTRRIPTRGSSA